MSGAVFGALTAVVIFSGGCSGGDGTGTTGSKQAVAATATAETNASCIAVAPFYWAIGDTSGTLVSGSVGAGAPVASTVMSIASGSKWLFGAYAVQKMGGTPASMYVPFLNFTSGYVGFNGNRCPSSATVDDCFADLGGMQIEADIGMFDYDGAHLQRLASLMGLGADDNAALTAEVKSQIGPEINFEYTQPQPAGGVDTSADQYALFLESFWSEARHHSSSARRSAATRYAPIPRRARPPSSVPSRAARPQLRAGTTV